MERQPSEDFSVVVLASDLGVDARSLLSPAERRARVAEEQAEPEEWHDCSDEDFSDLVALQILRFEGFDKSGNRILRIVGKYFPEESKAKKVIMERQPSEDFSVVVLASDLGVDARSLLSPAERRARVAEEQAEPEEWHDCSDEDFSDLVALQILRFEGFDKSGNRILRIVGKYFPATVITGERLKRYVFRKLRDELPEGPFCILYMHTTVQKEDNNPGMSILRWIYEDLPVEYKERLQVFYFLHPGIRSRLAIATLGRLFLSGNIYWKIKYVSRLQYLWEDIKKGQVEIPDFVQRHDGVLEHRPLTDYGIEPDPLHLTGVPTMECSFGRYEDKWASQDYM